MNTNRETVAYRSFQFLEFEVRGVRKVTTGEHTTLLCVFAESVALCWRKNIFIILAFMLTFYFITYYFTT